MPKLGPLAGAMFCLISLLAAGGWTYVFLTEQPAQMTKQGARIAIAVGVHLLPFWWFAVVGLIGAVLGQQWKPHVAWVIAWLLTGVAGGIATFIGWTYYLGPSV
jgi:hypothetical protein